MVKFIKKFKTDIINVTELKPVMCFEHLLMKYFQYLMDY